HDVAADPALGEPARGDESVPAVAPLAADDGDATPARAPRVRAQPREDRLGGAAPGVLHQRRPRDAELADRTLVEPAHLLAGEDRLHAQRPAGSVAACARKSARIVRYASRPSVRAARGSCSCSARPCGWPEKAVVA